MSGIINSCEYSIQKHLSLGLSQRDSFSESSPETFPTPPSDPSCDAGLDNSANTNRPVGWMVSHNDAWYYKYLCSSVSHSSGIGNEPQTPPYQETGLRLLHFHHHQEQSVRSIFVAHCSVE